MEFVEVKEEPPDRGSQRQPQIITIQPESINQLEKQQELNARVTGNRDISYTNISPAVQRIVPSNLNNSTGKTSSMKQFAQPQVILPKQRPIVPHMTTSLRQVLSNTFTTTRGPVISTWGSGCPQVSKINLNTGTVLLVPFTGSGGAVSTIPIAGVTPTIGTTFSNHNRLQIAPKSSQSSFSNTQKTPVISLQQNISGKSTSSTLGSSVSTVNRLSTLSNSETNNSRSIFSNIKLKKTNHANSKNREGPSSEVSENCTAAEEVTGNNSDIFSESSEKSNSIEDQIIAITTGSSKSLCFHCNLCNFMTHEADRIKIHHNSNHRRLCYVEGCSFSCSSYVDILQHISNVHPENKSELEKYDTVFVQRLKEDDPFVVVEYVLRPISETIGEQKTDKTQVNNLNSINRNTVASLAKESDQLESIHETVVDGRGNKYTCTETDCLLEFASFSLFQCHCLSSHNLFVYMQTLRKIYLTEEKSEHCMQWILKHGETLLDVENFCYYCTEQKCFNTRLLLICHVLIAHNAYIDSYGKGTKLDKKHSVKCLHLIKQTGDAGYSTDEADAYVEKIILKDSESNGAELQTAVEETSCSKDISGHSTGIEEKDRNVEKHMVKCFYCDTKSLKLDVILSHVTVVHPDQPVKVKRSVRLNVKKKKVPTATLR